MQQPLGLVAGDGRLPGEIARAAKEAGRPVAAIGFRGITDPCIEPQVTRVRWLELGQLQAAFDFFREERVVDAVLAGKVSKLHLRAGGLRPDERARSVLAALVDRRDDSILRALATEMEREGLCLRPQAELVSHLLVAEGVLGRVHPTPQGWEDVLFAWPIAKQLARLDIGQTVVVHERAVLAVEAIEGTDAAIRRGGRLGGPGLCIVKVAKPDQDPRFDLPALGLETIEVAAEAGAGILAFEASSTLVLDRPALVERADACGIAVVGVGAEPSSTPLWIGTDGTRRPGADPECRGGPLS